MAKFFAAEAAMRVTSLAICIHGSYGVCTDFPVEKLFRDARTITFPDGTIEIQKLIVGRNDRATLAAGVHEVVAQLREYSAYFEQERYRKFVRDRYGLRVYRPRLIALVGRDMWQMTSEEVRRAMTAYENLEVLTFDNLIEHCKTRILV